MQRIERIRTEVDVIATDQDPIDDLHSTPITHMVCLDSFENLREKDVQKIIPKSSKKSSSLDPMPTLLVIECLDVLPPVLTRMVNMSLQTRCFPENWKLADVRPGLKKSSSEAFFSNLRPINNLPFASKLTKRAAFNQMHNHLTDNNL